MKLAIMTWYHYRNYGTALQVTALSEKLRAMGHEPEVIKYRPLGYFRTAPEYTAQLIAKHAAKRIFCQHGVDYSKAFSSEERDNLFDNFLNEHISLSNTCETLTDLEELNDKYQAFICGSDQIWSPLCFDPHYFLDFVKDENKKVAYAPSMGVTKIEDKYVKEETKKALNRFGHISVREATGQKIVKELTGKTAEVVVDPTILFTGNEWKERFDLKDTSTNKPYAIAYMLGNNSEHWELSKKIAERNGLQLKVIPVFENDIKRDGCIVTPIGPQKFLELFYGASYVCTDSFHGLVFALLFHKPFSVFPRFRKDDPRNQNSRIICLLNQLNLQSRLIDKKQSLKFTDQPINYELIDNILQEGREQSNNYLSNALSDVPTEGNYHAKRVLENNSLCCGCGACAAVCPKNAIQIKMNEDGFYNAQIDTEKCVYCGKCIMSCPLCGKTAKQPAESAEIFSFKSCDEQVLASSTSGGAAYHIAKHLLQKGYEIVGCMFDRKSQTAKHIIVRDERELAMIQGSKYLQSEFFDALKEIAVSENKVAVFGTPCQIAAARRILKNRNDTVYVDLVCHGVPSYNLYNKYQDYLHRKAGIQPSEMQMVFRYKPEGWRTIHLYASDGVHSICSDKTEDPFFRMFEIGNCYMKACYECRWRGDSEADIRLGDYWGPRFEKDLTGVSMAIAFTAEGKKVLNSLSMQNNVGMSEQPINDYLKYQQKKNIPQPVFYDQLMAALRKDNIKIEDAVEKYAVPLENRVMSKKERFKHVIKMLRIRSTL